MIVALKNLAIELGRTPKATEFRESIVNGKHLIIEHFGSYDDMLEAVGMDSYHLSKLKMKKISNSIFDVNIVKHLENYVPKEFPLQDPYPRIALCSDIHFPFHAQKVLDQFYRFVEKEQPDHIVANGDVRDFYSHAKFPRSLNQFTPREENQLGRKMNEDMWNEIKKLCPKALLYQTTGNHSARPLKRIIEQYPEAEDWIADAMKKEFTFEGVHSVFDPREELMIGNVMIHHGYRSKLGDHMMYVLQNICTGHTHRGGAVFRRVHGKTIWELNSGYMGDPESKGLSYTSQKINDWTQGWGFVETDGPRFVPAR